MSLRLVEGPGKFEGCLVVDFLIYDIIMNGGDDGTHYNEGWGDSASLVIGPFKGLVDFTDGERQFLSEQAAAILYESTQGFVSVDWFESEDEAREHFDSIAGSYGDNE